MVTGNQTIILSPWWTECLEGEKCCRLDKVNTKANGLFVSPSLVLSISCSFSLSVSRDYNFYVFRTFILRKHIKFHFKYIHVSLKKKFSVLSIIIVTITADNYNINYQIASLAGLMIPLFFHTDCVLQFYLDNWYKWMKTRNLHPIKIWSLLTTCLWRKGCGNI